MNLKSLVPSRQRGGLVRPDVNLFGSLQREIDRLFNEFGQGLSSMQGKNALVPSTDVTETDKEIEITVELPGLERKDVEISLEDNVLTIRGEKKMEKEEKDKNKNYHVTERSYGMFYRVLELPNGIDPSSVQATMSKGVLKVKFPKPPRTAAKKIDVKEAA